MLSLFNSGSVCLASDKLLWVKWQPQQAVAGCSRVPCVDKGSVLVKGMCVVPDYHPGFMPPRGFDLRQTGYVPLLSDAQQQLVYQKFTAELGASSRVSTVSSIQICVRWVKIIIIMMNPARWIKSLRHMSHVRRSSLLQSDQT